MRALNYHLVRLLLKMLFAPFVKVRVLRPEMARRGGAWILASNHISHFDPPLIGVTMTRKVDWMGMVELFRNRAMAAPFRGIDCFPVDRGRLDRQAVRIALTRLRAGRVVGMFPEGGIRDGAASVLAGATVRPGVAGLSQMTGAPIIPCVIMGSDRCYITERWLRPGRRTPVWIAFGEPLSAPELPDRHGALEARAALEASLAEAFQKLGRELREHFNLSEEDLPQSPQRRRAEAKR